MRGFSGARRRPAARGTAILIAAWAALGVGAAPGAEAQNTTAPAADGGYGVNETEDGGGFDLGGSRLAEYSLGVLHGLATGGSVSPKPVYLLAGFAMFAAFVGLLAALRPKDVTSFLRTWSRVFTWVTGLLLAVGAAAVWWLLGALGGLLTAMGASTLIVLHDRGKFLAWARDAGRKTEVPKRP